VDPQEKAKPPAPSAGDGDYVGSETCITCHQDQERRFKNTIMGKTMEHPRNALEARGDSNPRPLRVKVAI
jgi:hypothetical protein